jgi:hypothetical protein
MISSLLYSATLLSVGTAHSVTLGKENSSTALDYTVLLLMIIQLTPSLRETAQESTPVSKIPRLSNRLKLMQILSMSVVEQS